MMTTQPIVIIALLPFLVLSWRSAVGGGGSGRIGDRRRWRRHVVGRFLLLLEGLEGLSDAEQLLALLLQLLGLLQQEATFGCQDGALDVAQSANDLVLEIFHLGLQIRLR